MQSINFGFLFFWIYLITVIWVLENQWCKDAYVTCMLSTLISLNADIIKIYIHIMNHIQLYIDHQQLKSVCLLNKCIGHYKKGTKKIFVHGLAFQTMQLNIISIWLTTDVYRMTKVSSRMTSREYMISTPPINQCSSLGQTWICMSLITWICNSILSLGYIDFRIERKRSFEVFLKCH